jgi:hypothetical protein
MKPTTALRRASLAFDPGAGPKRPETVPELDDRKILAGLIAQRQKAQKTLVEIQQVQTSGALTKAVTEKVNALKKALEQPLEAVKGALVVRVLGVTKHADEAARLPMVGLAVRLKTAEEVLAEAETNPAGVALMALEPKAASDGRGKDIPAADSKDGNGEPKAGKGDAKPKIRGVAHVVEVLAPDGSVAAVKKISLDGDTPSPVLIELGETTALTGVFTAAHPWLKARDAVTARAAEIKARNTKALKRHVKELEKTISRLDAAIERASKRKGGKDGDDTEGKKPVRRGGDDKGGRGSRNRRDRR